MADGEHSKVDGGAFCPTQAPIDAYGNWGFRFADMSHRGSLLCLPSGHYGWEASSMADVSLDTLGLLLKDAGEIEVLLLGTGAKQIFPGPELRQALQDHGIAVEAMATGAAARTYNVLLGEQRAVAAALIAVE
ncbi:MAG: hypothetical protein K0U74_08250 [Alphaproteobacteria bacterium]|nr:hypothetical protein [Alphaproteobacteria bacterium]